MRKILFGKPVSPDNYISRNDLDEELEILISEGRDIDLIGPNRTGKTAVCRYLTDSLQRKDIFEIRYVDLLHLKSPRISEAVSEITGTTIISSEDSELDEYIGANEDAVNVLLNYADKLTKPLVIILDEMDTGLSRKGFYHEWNASLRSLERAIEETSSNNISIVAVHASPPDYFEEMHMGHVISKRIGRGYVKYMPSLKEDEAQAYFSQLVTPACSVDAAFATKYAGTFPFLIDCLAFEVGRISNATPNYRTMLENFYLQSESFYKDLFDFILRKDNFWKTYSSSVLSLALIQAGSYDTPQVNANDKKFDLDEMEFRELCNLGVLKTDNDGNTVLFSPLFAWWVSRNAAQILTKDGKLSERLVEYFGAGDLKTLLGNIKSAQTIAGGIAAIL